MTRSAYDLGVRYIGGCCGIKAYHIRAISEEVSHSYFNKRILFFLYVLLSYVPVMAGYKWISTIPILFFVNIGYHMRGKSISVLSLEGFCHKCAANEGHL